jgi:mannose-1-phosphate guanylyltransferase
MNINVVLLAGGGGSRLWPLSNVDRPKQFIILPNLGYSSFQLAILQSLKLSSSNNIIITTHKNYRQLIELQLKELDLDFEKLQIIFEDSSDNTGKAIYDVCTKLQNENNDNLTYFLPTDHGKYEDQDFLVSCLTEIEQSKINIFGQNIQKACNKFGYIVKGKKLAENYYQVDSFIEKSALPMNISEVYRNLGIYLAKPSILYKEFHDLHQDLLEQFSLAFSIDKIIAEKSPNLNVITIDFNWHDLGSIEGLYKYCGAEELFDCSVDILEVKKFNEQNSEFKLKYDQKKIKIVKNKF